MTFTFIDIVFLIIILAFALTAALHGLIKEVFGKIAVIAGLYVAFFFCGALAPSLSGVVNNPTVDIVLAFVLLFIATFIFVKIIQIVLQKIFSGEILGSLDHMLGFAFGAVEGILVVSCVLILMKAQIWFDFSSLTENSTIYRILSPFLEKPISYIGGSFA